MNIFSSINFLSIYEINIVRLNVNTENNKSDFLLIGTKLIKTDITSPCVIYKYREIELN